MTVCPCRSHDPGVVLWPGLVSYYDRERAAGKKHNVALVCLARRRIDVLHAMLRNGTL